MTFPPTPEPGPEAALATASGTTAEPPPEVSAEAERSAAAAAARAGIRVCRVEDVAGARAVAEFLVRIWRTPPDNPPLPPDLVRSVWHGGGAVHAAYDADDQLAGVAAAIFGPPRARTVYSMVAAARTSDRGTGFAVKLAQRAWAVARGARSMSWTFDPLVGRNARFNLVKLGAVGVEYLIDFYGPMDDGLNAGDESDRLTARWDLWRPPRGAEPPRPPDGAATGVRTLGLAPDGGPLALRAERAIWCRVPGDVVAVRSADPAAAHRWRAGVREVFTAAFADGFRATGMSRDGWYHLTRDTPDSEEPCGST